MKNEDKIVELLSEQIKKQDSQEVLLAKQGELLTMVVEKQDLQEELLKKVVSGLTDLTNIFETKFNQVNNHETRITRLEDRIVS